VDEASPWSELGAAYAEGRGVPLDVGKALEWFHKAAAQGETTAQLNIGLLSSKGRAFILFYFPI